MGTPVRTPAVLSVGACAQAHKTRDESRMSCMLAWFETFQSFIVVAKTWTQWILVVTVIPISVLLFEHLSQCLTQKNHSISTFNLYLRFFSVFQWRWLEWEQLMDILKQSASLITSQMPLLRLSGSPFKTSNALSDTNKGTTGWMYYWWAIGLVCATDASLHFLYAIIKYLTPTGRY